ncbi:MAG: DUF4097 domain-containing protein [Thermoanaerobaculia bacterium]
MRRLALVLSLLAAAVPVLGAEDVFQKAYSLEGVTRVSVENVNGHIQAYAWDKPYLKVRAVKTARGGRADELLKLTEIRVRKEGEEIYVETVSPRRRRLFGFLNHGGAGAHVNYEIHLPPGVEAHLETCNGKVGASGFGGTLAADTVNGSIDLRDVAGPVRATTVNGSLRVEFRGIFKKSHLETVNGSVEIAFDRSSALRYDLETVNGRIEGDFALAVEGKFGPKEARGVYNASNAEGVETLRAETVNGSIRLKTN